jgi:tetraacyldisaccharide 4'-kinase
MDWRGLRTLGFAGIGRPEKFFATLRGLGAELAATHAFPDHASYHPRVLVRLETEARSLGAQLVTTEKDAVRLPRSFRPRVLVLPVRLELEDWSLLDTALIGFGLGAPRPRPVG